MNDSENIQNNIDTLLTFMNDDLEGHGITIKQGIFNFLPSGNAFNAFTNQHDWTEEAID